MHASLYFCCALRRESLLNRKTSVLLAVALGGIKMTLQRGAYRNTVKYEEMLNKAVDKALTRIFGSEAAGLIYSHLENNYSICKGEIAEKLDSFTRAMEEYLNSGVAVLEKEILESFYSGLGLFQLVELGNNDEFVDRIRKLTPH